MCVRMCHCVSGLVCYCAGVHVQCVRVSSRVGTILCVYVCICGRDRVRMCVLRVAS